METPIEENSATASPDDERPFVRASIREAAARLAPGARAVFVLHDIEGYTHEEIATALGITAGGSKSQLFKARVRMRRMLAHLAAPRDSANAAAQGDGVGAITDHSTGRSKSESRKLEIGGRSAPQTNAVRSWKGASQ
jgi:RNA polymerase sigma-70 factor (ECF subfamily)